MSVKIWGLVIGDDGTGFVIPVYAQIRGALETLARQLRGIANLQTQPGSLYGDFIDLVATGVDAALQGAQEAVARTIFTAMKDVALDQFLADYLERVVASPSTAVIYAYGSAGAAFGAGTLVRTSATSPAFATNGAVAIPAAPSEAYAVEIENFPIGKYPGLFFTVTVAGTPYIYGVNGGDDGKSVRDGLVALIAAAGLSQVPYRGGQSPTNGTYALLVIEESGAGPFALSVSGPAGAITAYSAIASPATCQVDGPTVASAESLRVFSPLTNIVGAVNVKNAILGRERETDSQFRARHQIAQRGLGGGSPDAIRAVMLSDPAIGGGGALLCSVEYNPDSVIDSAGNLPHSVRVIVDVNADGQTVANALWRVKAGGDNTNGPESYNVIDSQNNPQGPIRIDRFQDVWIGVEINVVPSVDWPNTGNPAAQLAQDVTDHIEALQPNGDVMVNELPISFSPSGDPRGVQNFRVRVGIGPGPGGPFIFLDEYPTVEPNAFLASIILNARQKARNVVTDVLVAVV